MNQHQERFKNHKKRQKFFLQLEILSNLRNLQAEIIKQFSTMSIHFDIKKDLRYQQGIEQGIEQGKAQGIEQGIEQGKAQGEQQKALNIARSMKIAGLPVAQIAAFTGLEVEMIEAL